MTVEYSKTWIAEGRKRTESTLIVIGKFSNKANAKDVAIDIMKRHSETWAYTQVIEERKGA